MADTLTMRATPDKYWKQVIEYGWFWVIGLREIDMAHEPVKARALWEQLQGLDWAVLTARAQHNGTPAGELDQLEENVASIADRRQASGFAVAREGFIF